MRNGLSLGRWRIALALPILVALGCGGSGDTGFDDEVDAGGEDGWTEGLDGVDVPSEDSRPDETVGEDVTDVPEEEVCTPLPAELCNGIDDTCEGDTDEGFDLAVDPDNCGSCGFECYRLPNADAVCEGGECLVGLCDYGYWDVNEASADGCEYECTPLTSGESWAGGTCDDTLDNDCDGRTDEDDTECSDCVPELCNAEDDDCDGLTDEDFDTDFDPIHCGECGNACSSRPNSTPSCVLGQCDIICAEGWTDSNGNLVDGCETTCVPSGDPTEVDCDGVDDDCDGLTDEDYVREVCGLGFCERRSVCHRGAVIPCTPRVPPATVDMTCDGLNEDCDDETDEEFVGVECGTGVCLAHSTCMDGFEIACSPGTPLSDTDATCDGVDDNCSGANDEDYVTTVTCGTGVCVATYRCVLGEEVCEPLPAGTEACGDSLDNDCDLLTDEEGGTGCVVYYRDHDGDGYGVTDDARCLCAPEGEYDTTDWGDCNDDAVAVNPVAVEICDTIDNNCDMSTDPEGADGCTNYYTDVDGDTWGVGTSRCYCAPTGNYRATRPGDCDDAAGMGGVNPGATETCLTAYDDDCDTLTNEQDAAACTWFYEDHDDDTYGTTNRQCWCAGTGDYTATRSSPVDCDDDAANVNPGMTDNCELSGTQIDNDCDGSANERDAAGCTTFYTDVDGDTYGIMPSQCWCSANGNYRATRTGDCDDTRGGVNPAATEDCNTAYDDNCNTATDEQNATNCTPYYQDGDNDTWGTTASQCWCLPGHGTYRATRTGDCADADAARNPGVPEACEVGTQIDTDCDGNANEQNATGCSTFYYDFDNDTYGTSAGQCWCAASGNYRAGRSGDCNDTLSSVNPGAAEVCDGVDNNCDSSTDPPGSSGCTNYYTDVDGDTWGVGMAQCLCSASGNYRATRVTDCNDNNVSVNPGATEVCNGVDDNCASGTDENPTTLCSAHDHATYNCLSATCQVVSCDASYTNANGLHPDGCECGGNDNPEAGSPCGASARDLGELDDVQGRVLATVTGKISLAGDVDCYRFYARDDNNTTGDAFDVEIAFTSGGNPTNNFRLTVYNSSCSALCSNVTDGYRQRYDFTTGTLTSKVGENPCSTTNTYDVNRCAASHATTYYFCITRPSGPTCAESYSVIVRNPNP